MSLSLMYITKNPVTAGIAQQAGVDRIWIDMEHIGKEQRQKGMDTVKSYHTVDDIRKIRPLITSSELLVRVNPIHEETASDQSSEQEIDQTVNAGADVIMLPYFKTANEIEKFVDYVGGRTKVQLLIETAEAVECLDEILSVPGIDEVHIGLNDLHLAYHQKFMFELLSDGTVEKICGKVADRGIKYGFGGIARVGYGTLPAEYIIAEHYRLGSTAAILSRGFCDANRVSNPESIRGIFIEGVKNIREREAEVSEYSSEQFENNRIIVDKKVKEIVASL